ncbi:MAG: hypothetical protein U9R46_13780 [Bacteroidota bacterium]|nr:hypothetical protein [Bacteroidota bacterium]
MEPLYNTSVIAENIQPANRIVVEADGTLRCLSIPPIYFGLDDEAEGFIFCEQGFYMHLINLD